MKKSEIEQIFPTSCLKYFSQEDLNKDIEVLKSMKQDFALRVYCTDEAINHLRFYTKKEYNLSDVILVLENMGFQVIRQRTYDLNFNNQTIYMQDFALYSKKRECIISNDFKYIEKLREGLSLILEKKVANDELNELLSTSSLDFHQIKLFRALVAYTQQIGTKYSLANIRNIYTKNYILVEMLWKYFDLKFNPEIKRDDEELNKLEESLLSKLKSVETLDEEVILKDTLGLLKAMLRTNFYSVDILKEGLAFKFESKQVPNIVKPAPKFEIFVYHKDVQGVHLRFGKVARGGLRWSDRPEDFRSEILGLVKTQVTKNAVIVPTGSKGGFVISKLAESTSGLSGKELGIYCYKIFINALLSVTDNIVNDEVQTPKNIVRYDDFDPYLVVAADKGTATFSDIANQISLDRSFWLQDAFASGGKNGYDHKAMGITARGAWESVKRHFRHLDKDIQTQDFSVVGIGGMSGDVFGNGMLLSKKIKLVAAFNHKFIFLDPNPDIEKTYEERQRLFKIAKSWDEYNTDLISEGGGLYSQKEKYIKLTPQVKKLLDIKDDELTPNQLISAILKSPIDLIWNGAIGTYFKSSEENNSDVPDRATDAIRVDAKDVRAKVIGEGGNLGATQKARIEFRRNGGFIYTDAIDNSAGVACSDREVNIKILLADILNNKEIDLEQRNEILESMTEQVGLKVLEDNYNQGKILDIEEKSILKNINYYKDLMNNLESKELLDRKIEDLPTNLEIDERISKGIMPLTAPELSILLAYSKIDLTESIKKSSLIKAPSLEPLLMNYFPEQLHVYKDYILKHKLRDEIIATVLSNYIINKMGITFISKMSSQTVNNVEDIVRSYLIAEKLLNLKSIYDSIDVLDNKVNAEIQVDLLIQLKEDLETKCLWALKNLQKPLHMASSVELLGDMIKQTGLIFKPYTELQNEESIKEEVIKLKGLHDLIQDMYIAMKIGLDFKKLKDLSKEVDRCLMLRELVLGVKSLKPKDSWEEIASRDMLDEINDIKFKVIKQLVKKNIPFDDLAKESHIGLNDFKSKVRSIPSTEFSYPKLQVLISRLKYITS